MRPSFAHRSIAFWIVSWSFVPAQTKSAAAFASAVEPAAATFTHTGSDCAAASTDATSTLAAMDIIFFMFNSRAYLKIMLVPVGMYGLKPGPRICRPHQNAAASADALRNVPVTVPAASDTASIRA